MIVDSSFRWNDTFGEAGMVGSCSKELGWSGFVGGLEFFFLNRSLRSLRSVGMTPEVRRQFFFF
jgi:hypothetical protein